MWFESIDDARIPDAAREAGGFWIGGFGPQPPAFGGPGLERVDVVLTAHGLDPFAVEYERAGVREVEGVAFRVLPLERIIARKRARIAPKTPPSSRLSRLPSSRVKRSPDGPQPHLGRAPRLLVSAPLEA